LAFAFAFAIAFSHTRALDALIIPFTLL
jgi:hypothetical protein